jgi:hypothetical protein
MNSYPFISSIDKDWLQIGLLGTELLQLISSVASMNVLLVKDSSPDPGRYSKSMFTSGASGSRKFPI